MCTTSREKLETKETPEKKVFLVLMACLENLDLLDLGVPQETLV